jgi:hypothetical protein
MERLERIRDADRPSSELIKELKQRYRELGSIPKEYDPARGPDGDLGESGPSETQNSDEPSGRARVELRIHHLEAILKERGHL